MVPTRPRLPSLRALARVLLASTLAAAPACGGAPISTPPDPIGNQQVLVGDDSWRFVTVLGAVERAGVDADDGAPAVPLAPLPRSLLGDDGSSDGEVPSLSRPALARAIERAASGEDRLALERCAAASEAAPCPVGFWVGRDANGELRVQADLPGRVVPLLDEPDLASARRQLAAWDGAGEVIELGPLSARLAEAAQPLGLDIREFPVERLADLDGSFTDVERAALGALLVRGMVVVAQSSTALVRPLRGGALVIVLWGEDCQQHLLAHVWVDAAGGAPVTIQSLPAGDDYRNCAFEGRHTAGVARCPWGTPGDAAGHFARAAHDEAASVVAFRRLAGELTALGAPARLVARVRAAARDEGRHATTMRRLGRRRGARPHPVRYAAPAPRTALAIARENAVEGCVQESYAAVLAQWQARHATEADHAAAMARIADDECAHGDLAWAVARWLEPRLPAEERRAVAAARAAALAALPALALATARHDATVPALGRPSPAAAAYRAGGLVAALRRRAAGVAGAAPSRPQG